MSGLGFSSESGSSSRGVGGPERVVPAPPANGQTQPGRPIQDRLVWLQPKPSRKALWRRRKQEKQRWEERWSPPRPVPPEMVGICFRCLRDDGHLKRDCQNLMVCIRCGEEGHGKGGCKRPRSPDSEEELRRRALALVASRIGRARGAAGSSQPGARGRGPPAAVQPGVPDRRAPAADRGMAPSQGQAATGARVA